MFSLSLCIGWRLKSSPACFTMAVVPILLLRPSPSLSSSPVPSPCTSVSQAFPRSSPLPGTLCILLGIHLSPNVPSPASSSLITQPKQLLQSSTQHPAHFSIAFTISDYYMFIAHLFPLKCEQRLFCTIILHPCDKASTSGCQRRKGWPLHWNITQH